MMNRISCLRMAALLGLLALSGCSGFKLHFPIDDPALAAAAVPASGAASAGQWGDARVKPVVAAATAASATVAASAPAAAGPEAAGYLIGPEDVLDISVWKDETLKSQVVVRPDGGISFPLAGELKAAGRTAGELREDLRKRLARFIPDAEVSVSVMHVVSYHVYVLGRVNKPGDIAVGRSIDVLQALALAGGMTPFADEDDIRVVRTVDGKPVTLPFDYTKVVKHGDLSQNIVLRSGDVLLVP